MDSEEKLENYLHSKPQNCVFINTSSCLIYCYQCDMELIDSKPGNGKYRFSLQQFDNRRSTLNGAGQTSYLELRKLFAKQIESDGDMKKMSRKGVNPTLLKNELYPLNTLMATMVSFYSIDYIRKLCKKRSLANLYSFDNYGIKLFKTTTTNFFDGIFQLGQDSIGNEENVLEKLYLSLLKDDPELFNYQYRDFSVS